MHFITSATLTVWLFVAIPGAFTLQAQDKPNYFYAGAGFQAAAVKNAYYDLTSAQFLNDNASGIIPKIAYEDFSDNGWMRFDCSLLLSAALSPIFKKPGLTFSNFQTYSPAAKSMGINAYLFNDKFIHSQGAWAPGRQDIMGPVLSLGLEGIGIVGAGETGKSKSLGGFRAMNNSNVGVLSYGTGLNFFNPLREVSIINNSRLTFTYDWFVKREYDDKFRVSGRGRLGIELAVFLKRFVGFNVYYHRVSFKRAYHYNETSPGGVQYGNAVVNSFGLGAFLYIFRL